MTHLIGEGTEPKGLRLSPVSEGQVYLGAQIVSVNDLGEAVRRPDGRTAFRGMVFSADDWSQVVKAAGAAEKEPKSARVKRGNAEAPKATD